MWTIDKLNQYIEEKVEESLYLDYKAAGSLEKTEGKKTEISKDVSSFANSDGGTIIYGVTEFQSGATFLPEKIDPIDRKLFSKETLEQIINSRISPRIHGVKITPISIGEPEENKVVYVVDIPKSDTAHQACNNKYYRRYNFLSTEMVDWEIKDIINRQTKSNIKIEFIPKDERTDVKFISKMSHIPILFDIRAVNVGQRAVKFCDLMIYGDEIAASYIQPEPKLLPNKKVFELYFTNEQDYKVTLNEKEFVINSQRMVILPNTFRKIGEIKIISGFIRDNIKLHLSTSLDDNRIQKKIIGEQILEND
jgi:hypothetical protein